MDVEDYYSYFQLKKDGKCFDISVSVEKGYFNTMKATWTLSEDSVLTVTYLEVPSAPQYKVKSVTESDLILFDVNYPSDEYSYKRVSDSEVKKYVK